MFTFIQRSVCFANIVGSFILKILKDKFLPRFDSRYFGKATYCVSLLNQ